MFVGQSIRCLEDVTCAVRQLVEELHVEQARRIIAVHEALSSKDAALVEH